VLRQILGFTQGEGARQVKDLIDIQHSTYVNGELFSTTPQGFFFTGIKPVVKLQTKEGYSLRLTENHQVLKLTAKRSTNNILNGLLFPN
jgi:ribonucleotide reductase class II